MARLAVAWLVVLIAGYAAGSMIRDAGFSWDPAAVADLRGSDHGTLTAVMRAITFTGSPLWLNALFLVIVVVLLARGNRRHATFLVLASPGTVALEQILKHAVSRTRPAGHHIVAAHGASWPSGHASSSLALYGALLLIVLDRSGPGGIRARRFCLAAIAPTAALVVLIGLSRVYLAVHYPTDVIAGWALAAAWLTILVRAGALSDDRIPVPYTPP
jgi:undecaprenyl-diphosphatase